MSHKADVRYRKSFEEAYNAWTPSVPKSLNLPGESFWAMPIQIAHWSIWASMSGSVFGWDMKNDRLEVLYKFKGPVYSSPLIRDNRIWIASDSGELTCFSWKLTNDCLSLDHEWTQHLEGAIHGTCSFDLKGNMLLVPVYERGVILVDAETGKIKHKIICDQGVEEDPYSTPISVSENIFLIGSQNNMLGIDVSGNIRYRICTNGLVDSSAVYDSKSKLALFGSEDGFIRAVHVATGEVIYEIDTKSPIRCSPAKVGDWALFGNQSRFVYLIQISTGLSEKIEIPATNPASYATQKKNALHYTAISSSKNAFYFVDGLGQINKLTHSNKPELVQCTPDGGAHTSPLCLQNQFVLAGNHFGQIHLVALKEHDV